MYSYWKQALRGEAPALSPSEADVAQCGYWRTKNGSLAIVHSKVFGDRDRFDVHQMKDGVHTSHSVSDKQPSVPGFAFAVPVSYEDYVHHWRHGVWPGQIAGLGHNTAGLSEFEEWKESVQSQCHDAERWLKEHSAAARTQVEADTAANYRDAIHKLVKRGEALLKAERAPVDEQLKEIRQRWGKVIDDAVLHIKRLREVVGEFLRTEQSREEKRVADERRRLAEEHKAAEDQDIALASLSSEIPSPQIRKVGAGGQLGRKTGLRTVKKAVIRDYRAALEFFANDPVIQETVDRLCQAEARMKDRREIPGVEYVENKEAI